MRLHRKRPIDHANRATPYRPTSDSALPDVVRAAERIVYAAKWRVYEEQAAARLHGTRSVRWTRLFPNSPVIVVVAVDGAVVGRVRRSDTGHWMVVPSGCARPIASRRTRRGAMAELARHVGAGRERGFP